MVVMALPWTSSTATAQERWASPSMRTVHTPHSAMPQVYFTLVIPRLSRKTYNKGVSGSASTCLATPFTMNVNMLPPLVAAFFLDED
jgi:hypothetical protein